MRVTTEQLERSLAELEHDVGEPRLGLWGPGSKSWEVNRELVVLVAGGRAALLQLAHPFVAHAIDQHSATRHDVLGRFERTFRHVFAMAFGDLDGAIASARRVHAIHARIEGVITERGGALDAGTPYGANDPDALVWVYATLVDSSVLAFELAARPLGADERQQYYRESWRFAKLFGIGSHELPRDWAAFEAYNRRMWHWLSVAAPAREMAGYLLGPSAKEPPAITPPALARWYRLMTAGLMPGPLRDAFGLRFGRRERLAFEASLRALRALRRALPPSLRYQPAYLDALRRLEGKPGRHRIGELVERYVLHAPIGGASTRSGGATNDRAP